MSEVSDQLRDVIRGLVDQPDAVEIEEVERGRTVLLQATVAPEELGRLIGRQGRTVRSLRSLLEVRGSARRKIYDLEIVEP